MGPLPKRKHSKGRRNRRRAHYKISPMTLQLCPTCKELKLPHRVCPNCGNYDGALVLDVQARAARRTAKKTDQ